MASATRWAPAIAFLGGLVGGDAISVVFTALAAFIQATVWPRAPWRAAILVLSGWAAGAGVGSLLTLVGGGHGFDATSQLSTGLTVLAAYASALAGAALAWVASRLAREG